MGPYQIATILIALGALYAVVAVLRTFIKAKKEEKIAETRSNNITDALDAVKFALASNADNGYPSASEPPDL